MTMRKTARRHKTTARRKTTASRGSARRWSADVMRQNRAERDLPTTRKRTLERAKSELRKAFGRED